MNNEFEKTKKSGVKKRGFTKVDNELIRNSGIGLSLFRFITYLMSYSADRTYPSRRIITRDTGMSDTTITKCIKEAIRYNLLSYIRGTDRRSNRYIIRPPFEWTLPQKTRTTENGDTLNSNDESTSLSESSSLNAIHQDLQNTAGNKTNTTNNNDINTNYQNQISNNKWTFDSLTDLAQVFFISELKATYQKCSQALSNRRYEDFFEAELNDPILVGQVFETYLELLSVGGSLYGWIENEFTRLTKKPTKWIPRPQFLTHKNSISSYRSSIYYNLEITEDLSKMAKGIPLNNFSQPFAKDQVYQKCKKTIDEYQYAGSIVDAAIHRITNQDKSVFELCSSVYFYMLFKEAVISKEYNESTQDSFANYCAEVGAKIDLPKLGQLMLKAEGGFNLYQIDTTESLGLH